MRHFYAKLSICLMVLSGLWSTLSAQQLDNFDEATFSIGLGLAESVAQGFTTGPGTTYQTVSVDINLLAGLSLTVTIREDDGGEPGNLVGTLGGALIQLGTSTFSGNVTLQPSTKYYLQIDALAGLTLSGVDNLNITTSDGFTADGEYLNDPLLGGWNDNPGERIRFTLTASNPLPVELTAFNAFKKDTEVALQWETAAEINNEGFAIERSADGRSWESLDFVSGHGTTEQAIRYQWMDEQPMRGHNYYRLKQMDFDGKFEYSPVVQVDFSESGDFEVFPNPATEVLQYQLGAEQEVQRLQVYGQDGRLFHESERIDGQLDLSNFPAGRYILRLITANGSMQKTFIVR